MSIPLLTTKLYVPPVRPELVPRPRLIERLDAGLYHKMVLVSAPPGFGKTTLLSQWVAHLELPIPDSGSISAGAYAGQKPQSEVWNLEKAHVAWLSLAEGDNDPTRFWSYLIAALQTARPGLGEASRMALQSSQPPPIEALLAGLLNELAGLSAPILLILDDYHLIEAEVIHTGLTFLVDHLPPPPGVQLVVATRADPPLPLARWRGRGALIEVRADDLRFMPDEAATFLNQVMGLDLSDQDVAGLEERTEGWVAGLQLAALALQAALSARGRQEVSGFVRAFAGDDRYIVDYLVEEVLQRQTEVIQGFLLRTSILDRLSGPLCDAVTGRNDSQAVLEGLERANLFLIPLDGKRIWYRYHQLFADLLRWRLQQTGPDRVVTLHRRASEWYERNGFTAEAVGHALAAHDFDKVADLIERVAWMLLSHGEIVTLLGWLEALPDELVRERLRLGLLYAWALVAAIRLDAVEQRLQDVEQRLTAVQALAGQEPGPVLSQADLRAVRGEIAAVRATVSGMWGDAAAAVEFSRQALACLPEENLLLRGVIANILGVAHRSSGDVAAASQAFVEAASLSQAAGNPLIALIALGNLAAAQEMQGQLGRAAATCQRALQLEAEEGRSLAPAIGMAHVGLGRLLGERGELAAAIRHLAEGIELGRKAGIPDLVVAGCVAMARMQQAQGDLTAALAVIEEAERLTQKHNLSPGLAADVAVWRMRLWLAQGNWQAATRWAQEARLDPDDQFSYPCQVQSIALVRFFVGTAPLKGISVRLDEAARLLEWLLRRAEAQGRLGQAIEILVLQALTFQAQGETDRALVALARALEIGEPEGYVRVFVDEGAPMARLLQRAASHGIMPGYVKKLLAALESSRQKGEEEGSPQPQAQPLIEPLSDRELEVLRSIAEGLSNREIAEMLVLTVGTVKWHIHNIYGKLDVNSRTQAIARAQELNLL